jgi:hypothetical protein
MPGQSLAAEMTVNPAKIQGLISGWLKPADGPALRAAGIVKSA